MEVNDATQLFGYKHSSKYPMVRDTENMVMWNVYGLSCPFSDMLS